MQSRFAMPAIVDGLPQPMIDITPVSVVFVAQGGWAPQVRRSYEASSETDAVNQLQNIVSQSKNGNRSVNMLELGEVSNKLLRPATYIDKKVSIVNGWDEPRFSFIMEFSKSLRNGKEFVFVYSGFTDYVGATWAGSIDPKMKLHITSVYSYMKDYNRDGIVHAQSQANNAIIVSERHYADPHRPFGVEYNNGGSFRPQEFVLDPASIFMASRRRAALEGTAIGGNNVFFAEGSVGALATPTMRANASPSFYLAQFMNKVGSSASYRSNPLWGENAEWEHTQIERGQELDMIGRDLKGTAPQSMRADPLFSLYASSTDINSSASIYWSDLRSTFPYIENDEITSIIYPETVAKKGFEPSTAIRNGVYNGQDQDQWNGSNLETIIATSIQQQLPALMMAEQIKSIRFTVTNMVNDPLAAQKYFWTIGFNDRSVYDNRSALVFMIPHDAAVGRRLLENFQIRVERTLLDGTFPDNTVGFSIVIDADVISGCHIGISIDGDAMQSFGTPLYVTSALSPYITGSVEVQNTIADTMGAIADSLF